MLIGVIISGIVEDYTINLCKGVESMAAADDVKVVVIPGRFLDIDFEKNLKNKYGFCYNSLYSYGMLSCFDGLVIEMSSLPMYTTEEKKEYFIKLFEKIPHVFVGYEKKGHSSVNIDNKAGLAEALEYMYKYGARKFATLSGPKENKDAEERRQVFLDFLKQNDLPFEDKQCEYGSFFLDCSREAEQLLENNPDADVIVCGNDILAKHIYNACKKYNRIPGKDISVLGFDDSDFCIATYPTISSVRTDIMELGIQSYELLMDMINGDSPKVVNVSSEFILRDSICHKDENNFGLKDENVDFYSVIKSNVHFEDYKYLDSLGEKISKMLSLMSIATDTDTEKVIVEVEQLLDDILLMDCINCIDWELFVNLLEMRYKNWLLSIHESNNKIAVTDFYVLLMKKMMKFSQTVNKQRANIDISSVYDMEAFFRDTMQHARISESNYGKLLNNLDFLGIQNAYLYLYDNPISYIQGEVFAIPDELNLKAMVFKGKSINVPQNSQKIPKEEVFTNDYITWKDYNKLILFPIYSERYLYGILICDMKSVGYEKAELFINQVSAAIRMLQLRLENNKIMNEYEESVRKLKENNITLDTMTKTDPLTGLNNRRGFFVRTEKLLQLCPNDTTSLLVGYADMNDLKIINDRFGHDDGDYSLKNIGVVLTDFVTMYNGFAARIGGDEFAFAITIPAGSNMETYKEELYDCFIEFNNTCSKTYNICVSVGCCLIEKGEDISIQDALSAADEMLYQEKAKKKKNILKG